MITPVQDYRRTDHNTPGKPLNGLDALVNEWVGIYKRRQGILRAVLRQAEQIDALAPQWKNVSDHVLQEKLESFRVAFRRDPEHPDLPLNEALAAVREAADRQVGLRPFVVQLAGALVLHRGWLAEMATGEGKTLTAGLAAVLAGWTSRPCHIITANDYLVQRDAEWLRPLYRFCGLKVGHVASAMNPTDRRAGYAADITYTTSKEIVADFLRDRLFLGPWLHPTRRLIHTLRRPAFGLRTSLVLRGLHTAIVDEADSLLIDEAVTPLIISTPHKNDILREAVKIAQEIARPLESGVDYTTNLRHKEVELTPTGRAKILEQSETLPRLFRSLGRRLELAKQALTAREFFLKGRQYIVLDGKVVIVDEFTGRLMQQRSWRAGLHQAVEAKEGLEVTDPTETMARLSFQRFFRLFYKMAGMTGTAREAASEFWQVYKLPVISIPTNKPCIRQESADRVFLTAEAKWQAILEDIQKTHASGRPILVGTRSVAASEQLAERLAAAGLQYHLLNATRHKEEAQIVAEAGVVGQITIATNMAGRGTDIRLGQGVAEHGGLHVIATERHESKRIDRQLFGRAARQGDPGSALAYISADDELLHRFLPKAILDRLRDTIRAGLPAAHKLASAAVAMAQKRAEKQAFHQRRAVLRMDTWLEEALSFASSRET